MRQLKALWRISRVLLHVLAGAWRIRTVFPHLTQLERDAEVQAWAQANEHLREKNCHPRIYDETTGTCFSAQKRSLLISLFISKIIDFATSLTPTKPLTPSE